MLDWIRDLFSGQGPRREPGATERDSLEARVERVEQIASGVEMAAAALEEDRKRLRRQAEDAAEAAVDAARSGRPRSSAEAEAGGPPDRRRAAEALARLTEGLEELHYDLLRCEIHPEVRAEEEREAAADRAREAVERVRDLAGELGEPTGASA